MLGILMLNPYMIEVCSQWLNITCTMYNTDVYGLYHSLGLIISNNDNGLLVQPTRQAFAARIGPCSSLPIVIFMCILKKS